MSQSYRLTTLRNLGKGIVRFLSGPARVQDTSKMQRHKSYAFISSSHLDRQFVEDFRGWLGEAGIPTETFGSAVKPGRAWDEEIDSPIKDGFAFIYVYNDLPSEFAENELRRAWRAEMAIFVVFPSTSIDAVGLTEQIKRTRRRRDRNDDIQKFIQTRTFAIAGPNAVRNFASLVGLLRDLRDQSDGRVYQGSNQLLITPTFGTVPNLPQFKTDVFMVMPFREQLTQIYTDQIRPMVEKLGLTIKRGDDFHSNHEILVEIWASINQCRLIVADLTGQNANVFYELGIAHTLGKPVILISQQLNDIPFDLRGKRTILYNTTEEGLSQLRNDLADAVQNMLP